MINIIIDELTNCLEVRQTGEIVDTYYKKRRKKFTDEEIAKMHAEGWSSNFNWKSVQDEGYQVYELRIKKDDEIQGYIALKHYTQDYYTFVPLVESAPWNRGSNGIYKGVGGHLFAIACKESWDNGNEGYVMFESKTDLVEHYIAASKLIHKYFFVRENCDENK